MFNAIASSGSHPAANMYIYFKTSMTVGPTLYTLSGPFLGGRNGTYSTLFSRFPYVNPFEYFSAPFFLNTICIGGKKSFKTFDQRGESVTFISTFARVSDQNTDIPD